MSNCLYEFDNRPVATRRPVAVRRPVATRRPVAVKRPTDTLDGENEAITVPAFPEPKVTVIETLPETAALLSNNANCTVTTVLTVLPVPAASVATVAFAVSIVQPSVTTGFNVVVRVVLLDTVLVVLRSIALTPV